MKQHYLNVEKVSAFKDLFYFFPNNHVNVRDEVVIDEANSGYDFIHRRVMYSLFREALIHYRRDLLGEYPTPIDYSNIPAFYEPAFFADTLTKETGVRFVVKKGDAFRS